MTGKLLAFALGAGVGYLLTNPQGQVITKNILAGLAGPELAILKALTGGGTGAKETDNAHETIEAGGSGGLQPGR